MAKTKTLQNVLPLAQHFSILSKGYIEVFAKKLAHLEIDRYFSILLYIDNTANCTQQHISAFFKTDKASMVRIMNCLSKHGMVDKRVNAADRRENLVFLTDKAKNILPEIHKAVEDVNALAMQGLSKKDIKHLYKYIETMQNNLDGHIINL